MVRVLSAVIILPAFAGCDSVASPKGNDYAATYAGDLDDADLSNLVRVDDHPSMVYVTLYRDKVGDPQGYLRLDGDIQLAGMFDIWDNGSDSYPINDIEIDGLDFYGLVDVDDATNVSLEGAFSANHESLTGEATAKIMTGVRLGKITLWRVPEEEDVVETGDTGVTTPTIP